MSQTVVDLARNTSLAIHEPGSLPARSALHSDPEPKVVITGDVRLRISACDAAHCPAKGHYTVAIEGLQRPLHVMWIVDGAVLTHSDREIDIVFDMRGRTVGETLTRQLSVQVSAQGGQGCVVHSSVFIQVVVVPDAASPTSPQIARRRTARSR